jgi:ATP-dependent exoDNAse (exonuclease V) beta subunit
MLREAEQGEPVRTLARLEQLMEKAYEPVDPDTASSNVVLSTVHGAKGLEFDSVFIPFLDWDPEGGRKDQPPPYMLERAPGCGDFLLATRPGRLLGEKSPLYERLRKLRARRQLGEAKRLFYVAVTRARRKLVMSGLAKKRGNSFSTAAQSPLGWLNQHYRLDQLCRFDRITCPEQAECADVSEWKSSARVGDGFFVQVEPDCGACGTIRIESTPSEMAPAQFEREKPVLTVISPSSLAVFKRTGSTVREDMSSATPGCGPAVSGAAFSSADLGCGPAVSGAAFSSADLGCGPAAWGTLVHSLLAEFGRKGGLPSDRKASAVLRRMGIDSRQSLEIARYALAEVESCLDDPWLQAFYSTAPELRRVEWAVECSHGHGTLYSGIIDLAAEIEGKWKLVDFKTSKPQEGESVEDFVQGEIETYAPQLLGYREICVKLTGKDQSQVDAFIYWTALRKKRIITSR